MKNQGRTFEMITMRRAGKTLDAIGNRFGLTRERVRQILDSVNEPKPIKIKKEKPQNNRVSWREKIAALEVGESFIYDGVITYSLISNVKTAAKNIGRKVQVYKFHGARIRVTRFD